MFIGNAFPKFYDACENTCIHRYSEYRDSQTAIPVRILGFLISRNSEWPEILKILGFLFTWIQWQLPRVSQTQTMMATNTDAG